MKIALIIATLVVTASTADAQFLKIDNGIVVSSFNNSRDLPYLYSDATSSYSVSLGADYLTTDFFYVSSQIGYMAIGGRENGTLSDLETQNDVVLNTSEKAHYVHFNTTLRAFISRDNGMKFFIGIGPYLNILAGNQRFDSPAFEGFDDFENIYAGGKGELGITHDLNNLRIGLVGSYMPSLSSPVKSEVISLNSNAYSLMFTTGYHIR